MDGCAASMHADKDAAPPTDRVLTDIAHYVYHYEITQPRALKRARLALLDALGCAMETLSNDECPSFVGPIVKGCTTWQGFRLPGTAFELDPLKGAFDMGVLIRYLDHNDAFTGAEWGHPSDNIGSILAVADWLSRNPAETSDTSPPLTIHTVLVALIKAYEIQGCFQTSNLFNSVGLDHVILVKVASTAVVSWLLGLSEAQAVDAISQAWMDGHPLRIYRHAHNTGPRKGWAGGDACMRAVQLALLTRSGQPGAPTVLSAPRWGFYDSVFQNREFLLPRPFGTWVIENTIFKIAPVEAHALSAIEAALILWRRFQGQAVDMEKDIRKIEVRTHAAACLIIDKSGHLRNAADRDHCMQYMLAVTFLKGVPPEYCDYSDSSPWATDQRVETLRRKIEIVEHEQYTKDYRCLDKRSMTSALTVELGDGSRTEEVSVEYPLGNPRHPGTAEAVGAKIQKNLGLLFSSGTADQIVRALSSETQTSVKDFVDILWKSS